MADSFKGAKLGILVGGGPAPGINGVISSVTIEAINCGMEVIGFQNGFKHLVEGSLTHNRQLTREDATACYLQGGSILGTSRTNPAKNPADMAKVIEVLQKLGVTCLVTIGGDDTAFSSSQVAKHIGAGSDRSDGHPLVRVCHVPKTIDNDLPLPEGVPTFGYETARHYGVLTTRALAADAKTTSRWYLVISMGRAAGHLALGIGKASAAAISLIPEEWKGKPITLPGIADTIVGSILKSRLQGKEYGVAVLAEGLLESIGEAGLLDAFGSEEELKRYGRIERDDHGHLRLGEIEFGRMIKDYLTNRLKSLGVPMTFIDKDLGYELRSADPIPFDSEYTRDLGYGAVRFLLSDEATKYGAVVSFIEGRLVPQSFQSMIDPKTSRMRNRKVNVDSESFACALRYMTRIETADLDDANTLAGLSKLVEMSPEQFKERFAPVAIGGRA